MPKLWYAIYTKPRNEKKAHAALQEKGIHSYLPLMETLKQWSDRKKKVEEPLFKSYLFVHITPDQYYHVLNTPGVVKYITFEGKAVPIPEVQIRAIDYFLDTDPETTEELPDLKPGQPVEVIHGAMKGLHGTVAEEAGRYKVRVEIDALGQSVLLTVGRSLLRLAGGS
jgi:transcription antitermination factor NusG